MDFKLNKEQEDIENLLEEEIYGKSNNECYRCRNPHGSAVFGPKYPHQGGDEYQRAVCIAAVFHQQHVTQNT